MGSEGGGARRRPRPTRRLMQVRKLFWVAASGVKVLAGICVWWGAADMATSTAIRAKEAASKPAWGRRGICNGSSNKIETKGELHSIAQKCNYNSCSSIIARMGTQQVQRWSDHETDTACNDSCGNRGEW